jgi:hypothetical protein
MANNETQTTLSDEEIEAIWEQAAHDAIQCAHIAATVNPYSSDDPRAEIYSFAFRGAYARENGF